MSLRPAWLTFRRYAAATTGMTLSLFALGVYTAATGSGLACQAQWPLCSDQLIPALTINPDFIEWFHRVWAMITGFLIIGVAAWTWLGGFDRRTRLAATLAVAILPLQITVGAITVTIGGLVPSGYTVSTHAAAPPSTTARPSATRLICCHRVVYNTRSRPRSSVTTSAPTAPAASVRTVPAVDRSTPT